MWKNNLKINRKVVNSRALQDDIEQTGNDTEELKRRMMLRKSRIDSLHETETERVSRNLITPHVPYRTRARKPYARDGRATELESIRAGKYNDLANAQKIYYMTHIQHKARGIEDEKSIMAEYKQSHSEPKKVPNYVESRTLGNPVSTGGTNSISTSNQNRRNL